jgi:hypothetical protein
MTVVFEVYSFCQVNVMGQEFHSAQLKPELMYALKASKEQKCLSETAPSGPDFAPLPPSQGVSSRKISSKWNSHGVPRTVWHSSPMLMSFLDSGPVLGGLWQWLQTHILYYQSGGERQGEYSDHFSFKEPRLGPVTD